MSARSKLINGAFGGQKNPLDRVLYQKGDATSPDGVITAPKGTLFVIDYDGDDSDDDAYINNDGSSGWTQIYNPVA